MVQGFFIFKIHITSGLNVEIIQIKNKAQYIKVNKIAKFEGSMLKVFKVFINNLL